MRESGSGNPNWGLKFERGLIYIFYEATLWLEWMMDALGSFSRSSFELTLNFFWQWIIDMDWIGFGLIFFCF